MKIAICVPSRDHVHVGFTKCLANLTASLQKDNIDFEILINMGTVIPEQRNTLVEHALKIDATHILWLDTDMHFPHQTVQKLLKHNKPIVACAYSTRIKPLKSVAFVDKNNLDLRLKETTGLHQVWAVGMGCMLVDIQVYNMLPQPWHNYNYNKQYNSLTGEDIYFCNLAGDTGYEIYVDADLSNSIGHYGTKAYTLGETHDSI